MISMRQNWQRWWRAVHWFSVLVSQGLRVRILRLLRRNLLKSGFLWSSWNEISFEPTGVSEQMPSIT